MIACPILIYDPALKLLAYSHMYPGLDDHIFQSAITNGYLDLETVKYFEKKHIFDEMDHTGSALGEPDDFRVHADFLKNRSVTDYFLMDLLENPDVSEDQIRERIYYNDLDYEGNYILINLYSDIRQKASENYFIRILRNNMINCRIFSYRKSIIILYHLPKFREIDYRDYLREQLQQLLNNFSDYCLQLYFSKPFHTIGQFATAYQQTENLYHMQILSENDIYCFYEDHWLENLIFSLPEKDKTFSFCEPCILQMALKNTKKSRQQLSILYEYLNCDRKLTDVAQKLDMHRNNVLYHIRQLEERCQLDLDDPKTRLKLLISFEIIKFPQMPGSASL